MDGRSTLRTQAKKIYKERVKGIPKKQRIPFSEFFKKYKNLLATQDDKSNAPSSENAAPEDFDFEDVVNLNDISDDSTKEEDDE